MSAPQFTPAPWEAVEATEHHGFYVTSAFGNTICDLYAMSRPDMPSTANGGPSKPVPFMHEMDGPNARLIASAPDHALICWAMCVQDARWEEWVPFDGKGEFCFAGLKYATSLDEFGCPRLTDALRTAITRSQMVPA